MHVYSIFLNLNNTLKSKLSGAWVAQSVKHPTLDFGSCHDPRIVGSNPASGSTLTAWKLLGILSLSLSLPLPLSPARALSLSKIKKKNLNK